MKNNYPVLTVKDLVIFPHVVVPLFVGRSKSIKALNAAMETDRKVVFLTQKNAQDEEPDFKDLYHVGVIGTILQMLNLPDGSVKILVDGFDRVRVTDFTEKNGYRECVCEVLEKANYDSTEIEAYSRMVLEQFEIYSRLNKRISVDTINAIKNLPAPDNIIDVIAAHLTIKVQDKQSILEETDTLHRFEKLLKFLESEIDVIHVEKKIRNRVKKQMEKSQKDYYLTEQIKAIQKELGDSDVSVDGVSDFKKKAKDIKFPKEVKEKFEAELRKLSNIPSMSPESTIVKNYLDWLLSIPWGVKTKVNRSISKAKKILDEDHYGLDNVKERILEFLAVQNRVKKMKGGILCFMGPPGVGKTSLAKSIARATGRNYVRISLGGVTDESEIRGHRRTYIGALPGKIISSLKKAKSSNPLFLLDEIDKVGSDWKGDPASALLEVLDPEQNANFNDHYLEVDCDLSDIMFITTANTYNMPSPLLDRLEIINLSGYTEMEKKEIARKYLIPKQMSENGLKEEEVTISDDVIMKIIRDYTREAGVRNLERELAKICRKVVKELDADSDKKKVEVNLKNLETYLGVEKFKRQDIEDKNLIGVVTGLAWTEVGGELLSIEAVSVPGKGKIILTGKLGDVMQESIQAAISFVRSRATSFKIDSKTFEESDIHVHVPEGATPKDGPSAGVAMVTSVVSCLTGIPIRRDVAMTGEITLRGRVLPIGGLKEKLLAAHRGGIKTVLIPSENERDLKDIPECVLNDLEIIKVSAVDEVLKVALEKQIS